MRKENRAQRAKRKAAAAKRTAWNTYSIHDLKEVARRLSLQHEMKKVVAAKAGLPVPTDRDLQRAIDQNVNRELRFSGNFGLYTPHQGSRECRRRRRQTCTGEFAHVNR